ncbi:decapping nuclease DXO homolog [Calliphora vicina]|uniref:decapping nuclease DXO homolog n=1 Tax=Calliphora vicina TaxID=7373 RepID=UPI00325B40F8
MFLYEITPQSLSKYKEKRVLFSQPNLVGLYDYNYGKNTKAKRINYLKIPKLNVYPIDLNEGFAKYISRNSSMYSRYIDVSLKYDMTSAAERDGVVNIEKTKVITRRGTLVNIMQSYYYKRQYDELKIRVSRYNGNLYMVMEEEDGSLFELKAVETHHGRLEKLLFTDSPDNPPKIDEPYDDNIELVGIHRSNFGKYDIIYSGEIQGIDSNEEIKDFDDFDALNSCCFVFSKQMWNTLKYKDNRYLTYWLQSYLANVEDVYIGYKNDNGTIEKPIKRKAAVDIPKNRFWQPSICTGFLYDFLQNVEKRMSSVNCLNTVFLFHYDEEKKRFTYEIFKGQTEKTFISKEYMKYCMEKSNG